LSWLSATGTGKLGVELSSCLPVKDGVRAAGAPSHVGFRLAAHRADDGSAEMLSKLAQQPPDTASGGMDQHDIA
jgi:hypothetical protein